MGTGHWKDHPKTRCLGLAASSPSSGKGEGLETEFIPNHAYVMRPPLKMPNL